MIITRPAPSVFIIQTKNSEEIEIVFDPQIEKNKITVPRGKSNVYLSTAIGALPADLASASGALAIDSAGEFELKGVFVFGIPCRPGAGEAGASSTLFVIESEGMHVCALGLFGQDKLLPEQVEKIGSVDVLIVPLGSEGLTPVQAAGIVEQLEPRIVLTSVRGVLSADSIEQCSKKTGVKPETLDKLKLAKKDLPQEETRLVILEEK